MPLAAERWVRMRQPVDRIVTGQPDGPGDRPPGHPAHYLLDVSAWAGAPYWEANAAAALFSSPPMAGC